MCHEKEPLQDGRKVRCSGGTGALAEARLCVLMVLQPPFLAVEASESIGSSIESLKTTK